MLNMSQINSIIDLKQKGYRNSEIAKKEKVDVKTVRKYLQQEDYSPEPPTVTMWPSNLDPFKHVINGWLEDDRKHWHQNRPRVLRVLLHFITCEGETPEPSERPSLGCIH